MGRLSERPTAAAEAPDRLLLWMQQRARAALTTRPVILIGADRAPAVRWDGPTRSRWIRSKWTALRPLLRPMTSYSSPALDAAGSVCNLMFFFCVFCRGRSTFMKRPWRVRAIWCITNSLLRRVYLSRVVVFNCGLWQWLVGTAGWQPTIHQHLQHWCWEQRRPSRYLYGTIYRESGFYEFLQIKKIKLKKCIS